MSGEGSAPEIAVAVPSHDRPLRLRWLLNALEKQTLGGDRFEVCVVHDSSGPETEVLLTTHPLAARGTLRHEQLEPMRYGSAGLKRNRAWRMARAPLIVFTDDDCYPPSDWLERAVESAGRNPGVVVQGVTLPEPEEGRSEGHGPWPHTQKIEDPPTPWGEACNILYPRELLERLCGYVEEPPLEVAEDTDLLVRAQKAGASVVGDRSMVTYHAIESAPLYKRLRGTWRWRDNAWLVKTHPDFKRAYPYGLFWKKTHAWLPPALAGLVLGRRNLLFLLLAVPYVALATPQRGSDTRGRLRALSELPGVAAIDAAEIAVHVCGSVKYRTLFL